VKTERMGKGHLPLQNREFKNLSDMARGELTMQLGKLVYKQACVRSIVLITCTGSMYEMTMNSGIVQ